MADRDRPNPTTKEEAKEFGRGLVADGWAENSVGFIIANRAKHSGLDPHLAWTIFEAAQEALAEVRAKAASKA